MTGHRTKPRPTSTVCSAPPAPMRPARVSPAVLADAATTDRPAASSLAMATAIPTDAERYTVRERDAATHAMDYSLGARDALTFVDSTSWPGFPTLALLAQLPEYRTMHETLADEAVRTWGQVTCTSDDAAAAAKLPKLMQALDRYGVRALVRTAVIHDQAFGGAHVFPQLRAAADDLPCDAPLLMRPEFVAKDCLAGFAAIEPYWVTPNAYNATDPTKPNFYQPESWYMLAKQVHASRLFTVISRPVPDMLKAAYSFRGVSLSQLAMAYVDNWLRTRQSVSDTVKQFSITYLKADLSQMLQPGGTLSLMERAQLFNLYRDNRNLGLVDMNQEDLAQINTPLSGLDALQAQAQEQLAAVSHIPLVKLLGITPAGLNANSDGEIRVWYDYVAGYQAHNLSPLMRRILELVQLSEFGEIDPGLSWEWNPLYELTDLELADMRERNARTDLAYLEAGVISGEQVQERLAADPQSGYAGLMAERDTLDEVEDIAQRMLAEAVAPNLATEDEPADDPGAVVQQAATNPADDGLQD